MTAKETSYTALTARRPQSTQTRTLPRSQRWRQFSCVAVTENAHRAFEIREQQRNDAYVSGARVDNRKKQRGACAFASSDRGLRLTGYSDPVQSQSHCDASIWHFDVNVCYTEYHRVRGHGMKAHYYILLRKYGLVKYCCSLNVCLRHCSSCSPSQKS